MKERIMQEKDSVAFKKELILHTLSKGFCCHWKNEGHTGSLHNWELTRSNARVLKPRVGHLPVGAPQDSGIKHCIWQ